MLFAFLVLGEHVEFRDLLGIVPIALGIYLVTRSAAVAGQAARRVSGPACPVLRP
jgi:drug/metabolite transporter (DMT)-like permease